MKDILAIHDVHALHDIIMERDRERQLMASDLDMAARLGLAISEANEELQAKVSMGLALPYCWKHRIDGAFAGVSTRTRAR